MHPRRLEAPSQCEARIFEEIGVHGSMDERRRWVRWRVQPPGILRQYARGQPTLVNANSSPWTQALVPHSGAAGWAGER